jgi:hypothetical protein
MSIVRSPLQTCSSRSSSRVRSTAKAAPRQHARSSSCSRCPTAPRWFRPRSRAPTPGRGQSARRPKQARQQTDADGKAIDRPPGDRTRPVHAAARAAARSCPSVDDFIGAHDIDEALHLSDRVVLLGSHATGTFAVPAPRPRVRGSAGASIKRALLERLQASHAF